MGRNIIICCDGTGNEFESVNTSVVRILQCVDRSSENQLVYYDPGVGTLPEPGIIGSIKKKFKQIIGLAIGYGIIGNVEQAYAYLMNTWERGDQIYLFGFSRGAYTVRILAAILHTFGLMTKGNDNLIPYLIQMYKAVPNNKGERGEWRKLCDEFRLTFARPMAENGERRCPVHFMGIWDTVSSVGWVWDPKAFPYTRNNPGIATIRHAVSIDERRCFFRQNLIKEDAVKDLEQYWFAGVHSDVGGGYPEEESGLWRVTFDWMVKEAEEADLLFDSENLWKIRHKTDPPVDPWAEPQHESLKGLWWIAEGFPKLVWNRKAGRALPQFGLGRHRHIPKGARIYRSALLRIRETDYRPPNMTEAFISKVKGLQDVPEWLNYDPDV